MKHRTQNLRYLQYLLSFKNCNRIKFKFKLARSNSRKRNKFKSYINQNQFLLTNSNNFILYYTYIHEVLYLNHKGFRSHLYPNNSNMNNELEQLDETSCIIIYYWTGRKSYSKVLHFWSQKIVPRMAWILTFQAIALVLALTTQNCVTSRNLDMARLMHFEFPTSCYKV